MTEPAVEVSGLVVTTGRGARIVDGVNLTVGAGEVLGLVGESGSGKTTLALSLLGYTRPGARIEQGAIAIAGRPLPLDDERGLRGLRGDLVSYVPQDPGTALNPTIRIGDQVADLLRVHRGGGIDNAVADVLRRVRLPDDAAFRRRFAHQLSGGQQQRLAMAMAVVCEPPVVVLDEPTTGLDVVTQRHVLEEVARLRSALGVAIIIVSHDLAVVSTVADRVAVMYAGRLVEEGPTAEVIGRPRHPYTRGLVSSVPDHVAPRRLRGIPGVAVGVDDRPEGCAFAPRCELATDACRVAPPPLLDVAAGHRAACLRWAETPPVVEEPRAPAEPAADRAPLLVVDALRATHPSPLGPVLAADDVSFAVAPHECVALVGESGSGKTTIARCVAGLHEPAGGRILLAGEPLQGRTAQRSARARRRLQLVFQNPYDSLNPRRTAGEAVRRPVELFGGLRRREADARVRELFAQVRLSERLLGRYPAELSGGERQRVAIARALAAGPELLICDEVTSALDVSVQAAVLDLVGELRRELGLALLFITHDLGVVAALADRVLVLQHGRLRESGRVDDLLGHPQHDYTRTLVSAAPALARRA